ncbi:MAG TPA: hypothetical protein VNK44_02655 [Candidatus Nitrosotenuis sp.]|nr:hypothetical protein [Candidatus Nitrosotenuis sp.]
MTYPYGLKANPYPSSPTPTEHDAKILGGTRHQEAKAAIIECISDLYKKTSRRNSTENDFRLVTIVQDVGSGKTHLALHIKTLKTRQDIVTTYVDLSTISPKTNESIYNAIMRGFNKELFSELKAAFLAQIAEKAQKGDQLARRALGYGIVDKLKGVTIKQKSEEILYDKKTVAAGPLQDYLAANYNQHEAVVIRNIICNSFDKITNLDEMHGRLAAIARFSHNLLGKVTLFELDEFDAQQGSLEFVKSLINAHIPASILLLITTPSLYLDVQKANPSVFDRLEKANYKIDLAGANSIDELIEIAIEYIKEADKTERFNKKEQQDLASKIRVLCDEFPEFRNVRSIINILNHAIEKAAELDAPEITEAVIDETIKQTYPGLKIKGSIMEVPISEFIKLKRTCGATQNQIKQAVSNLVNFAHDIGNVSKTTKPNPSFDVVYSDPYGTKIGITVVMDSNHTKNFETISNIVKSSAFVDKLVILTNTSIPQSGQATIVNVDKSKLIDLLYFNTKYTQHKLDEPESEKVKMLAKTICVI